MKKLAKSRLFTPFLLFAVRHGLPVPAGLVRRLAGDLDLISVSFDGWERQLLDASVTAGPPPQVSVAPPREPAVPHAPALRCLVACGDFDVGGVAEVAAFLARRLPAHGVATSLAFTPGTYRTHGDRRQRLADALRAAGVTLTEVATAEHAARMLDEGALDVIHTHGAPDWWVKEAVPRGIPIVNTSHGLFYEDWTFDPHWGPRAAAVIAVSDATRAGVLERNPRLEERRVITIYNCADEQRLGTVDRDAARRWLGLRDEYLFVSLARPSIQKNQIGLFRGFAEVAARHPDVHLLNVGGVTQPMYARMAEIVAATSPVASRIHLREHLNQPTALLAAADGFVLNPFFEGGPLATMEALVFGVPVVVSEAAAAPGQVGDGWAGHVIPNPTGEPNSSQVDADVAPFILGAQRNHRELVTAMLDLVEHRQQWAARRDQIAATAVERFGAEVCLRRHAEVLASAVAEANMPDRHTAERGAKG